MIWKFHKNSNTNRSYVKYFRANLNFDYFEWKKLCDQNFFQLNITFRNLMKAFLAKTKESIQAANNRIAAQVVGGKFEETPEYTEVSKHLDEVHEKFQKMSESVSQVNSIFKENQKVFGKLPEILNSSVAEGEENKVDYNKVTAACEKVNNELFKKYVSEPLKQALDQTRHLREVRDKRVTARAIYENANKLQEDRKAKGKETPENLEKYDKEVEEKKTKYEELDKEFLEGAKKVYEDRNETVKKVFAAFTYYYTNVNKLINEQLTSTCSTYSITVNEGDYTPITGE